MGDGGVARREGFKYVWIDTCCIDKESSAELSEAINPMFRWYQRSKICYAYLSDVSTSKEKDSDAVKRAFAASKWFTRGWTLQELLAPDEVLFFDHDWARIGTSGSRRDSKYMGIFSTATRVPHRPMPDRGSNLRAEILAVTGIQKINFQYPMGASMANGMAWASKREATREEDMAYCLMGLFNVNMPLLYGEGTKAFLRLQRQILQQSDDESIFAWTQNSLLSGLLAPSPANFSNSFNVSRLEHISRRPYAMTNKGLHVDLEVYKIPATDLFSKVAAFVTGRLIGIFEPKIKSLWAAPLNCAGETGKPLVIYLVDMGEHFRVGPVEELPEHYSSYPKMKQEFYVGQNPEREFFLIIQQQWFDLHFGRQGG